PPDPGQRYLQGEVAARKTAEERALRFPRLALHSRSGHQKPTRWRSAGRAWKATAISAATLALLTTSALFASRAFSPSLATTRSRRNGVSALPVIFSFAAAATASATAGSTSLAGKADLIGTGLAK